MRIFGPELGRAADFERKGVKVEAAAYVDFLMDKWQMRECSDRILGCLRRVLGELTSEALLALRDPKLEVMVMPEPGFSVWAYFPVHRKRSIARKLTPKPATRVLIVLGEEQFGKQSVRRSANDLRHHFGHTLLYLRSPRARNDCVDAEREWRASRA